VSLPGRIEAVLLDAGGVLMLPSHAPILAALAAAGLRADPARLDAAHYAGMRGLDEAPDGPFEWRHYLVGYVRALAISRAARAVAIDALRAPFDDPAQLWRRPAPGVGAALGALAALGIRLGVVSNAEGTVAARLAELAICQVGAGAGVPVEVVIDSHRVGVEKPDPAIFGFALRAMALDPARCLYVGDSVRIDVAGARGAGLAPVLVDPDGSAATPAPRVRALAELPDLLSAGSRPR
jgi:putative hydrolase of the HAD superfamily